MKHNYGVKLYPPKLELNKLKVTRGEFLSFVHYYGFCSKKYISKDFKRFENISN
jgi:hypothetical protein